MPRTTKVPAAVGPQTLQAAFGDPDLRIIKPIGGGPGLTDGHRGLCRSMNSIL